MNVTTHYQFVMGLGLAIGLAGCGHRETPAPADPTPTYSLRRTLSYPAIALPANSAQYATPAVTGTTTETAGTVRLYFSASPDAVSLTLPAAALTTTGAGDYALQCAARPAAPVAVTYYYQYAAGSTGWLTPSLDYTTLTGKLTITNYDSARHLLSGSYVVSAPDQVDPSTGPSGSLRKCDVELAGEFADLSLKFTP